MADKNKVLCELVNGLGEAKIGVLVLNKPQALNALDVDMANALLHQLSEWKTNPDVKCVMISGAQDKAFCAGGDVVSMHQAMLENTGQIPAAIEQFFTTEYQLDYLIRVYPKPVIVIGHGIVMGGGMGLFTAASHSVVTPSTRLAMPEISIGLYPDVGATYFLSRLKNSVGLFLGITGVPFNGKDALHIGLAQHFIGDNQSDTLLAMLQNTKWESCSYTQVNEVLQHLSIPTDKPSLVAEHENHIASLGECTTPKQINDFMQALPEEDKWLAKAKRTFSKGSALTACIVVEQMQRGAHLSLAECFRLELTLSCRCAAFGEFQEGVRALLIDKDNTPAWRYANMTEVEDQVITEFFTSLWDDDAHPLKQLEQLGVVA